MNSKTKRFCCVAYCWHTTGPDTQVNYSHKSPSFSMTTFSASLTNLTVPLPQSRGNSCYVSRPTLAPPPLWLQKHTDLRAHDFAHFPDLWHQPRLANFTSIWSWTLCGNTPTIPNITYLTPFREFLTVTQLPNKFSIFQWDRFISVSQKPATGSCPQSDKSRSSHAGFLDKY